MKPVSAQPLPDNAKKVFSGIVFDVYQWQQPQFDGSVKTFEKLKRPSTVVVIPVTEDGLIVLTKQEQPGKPAFMGFTGGRAEEGEEPETAAHRELLEESGYATDDLELIDARQPTSKIEWTVYTFVARNCRKVAEQNLDSGERITLMPTPFDEFLEIAVREDFAEPELMRRFLEAKYEPAKKAELKALLLG